MKQYENLVEVHIPLHEGIKKEPRDENSMKELCTKKEELKADEKVSKEENVLAVVQKKFPSEYKDPNNFIIPRTTRNKRMKRKILDMQDLYVPCYTPVLLGKFAMKHPSDMPIVCSKAEIDPGPKRVCNHYLESPHQKVNSLHSFMNDETRVPPLGPPPWRGKSELVPFRNYTKRQVGVDYCKLFFKSSQEYYHIPFMEWVMKKLFKMGGLTPGSNFEFMAEGVNVHMKNPD